MPTQKHKKRVCSRFVAAQSRLPSRKLVRAESFMRGKCPSKKAYTFALGVRRNRYGHWRFDFVGPFGSYVSPSHPDVTKKNPSASGTELRTETRCALLGAFLRAARFGLSTNMYACTLARTFARCAASLIHSIRDCVSSKWQSIRHYEITSNVISVSEMHENWIQE